MFALFIHLTRNDLILFRKSTESPPRLRQPDIRFESINVAAPFVARNSSDGSDKVLYRAIYRRYVLFLPPATLSNAIPGNAY